MMTVYQQLVTLARTKDVLETVSRDDWCALERANRENAAARRWLYNHGYSHLDAFVQDGRVVVINALNGRFVGQL